MPGISTIGRGTRLELDFYTTFFGEVNVPGDRVFQRALEVILHGGDDRTVTACNFAADVSTAKEVVEADRLIQDNASVGDPAPGFFAVFLLPASLKSST